MAPDSAVRTSFALLGPLEVRTDGDLVDIGSPKQRVVLGALLLEQGRVVSTDRLTAAVWGDAPPPRALASLQAYISHLRRLLALAGGSAILERRPPGYRLDVARGSTDLEQFLDLVVAARVAADQRAWNSCSHAVSTANGLWRGSLLADLVDLVEQDWVSPQVVRLEEMRTEATELQVRALLGLGRDAEALVLAQELTSSRPLRDGSRWLHVLALHRTGRSAEALEVHRAHARALAEELGIDPSPQLRRLQAQLLSQDPSLQKWPGPSSDGPSDGPSDSPTDVRLDPSPQLHPPRMPSPPAAAELTGALVGRAAETAVLDGVLADVARDRTRWLLLTGPAGIGKTRLAEVAAAQLVASGGGEAWARCPEGESVPAWWPWRQVVRALGGEPQDVLVPPAGADADSARFAVYEQVLAHLREAAARRPLIVVFDDAQWADAVSLRCLAHLARELRHVPVLFVVTVRDGSSSQEVDLVLSTLARTRGVAVVDVPPLDADEVAQLLTGITGEPVTGGHARQLAERTGGNPLFVAEYARLPAAERAGALPAAVRTVLGRRLSLVDAAVLTVLRAGAVAGDLDAELLSAATGVAVVEVLDVMDAAASQHLLTVERGTGRYAFAHPLLREQVIAELPVPRRKRLHLELAAALADGGPAAAERRAAHLVAAQPLSDAREVVEACRDAAAEADARWDAEAAAGWLGAALKALDRLPSSSRGDERDVLLTRRVFALARAGRGQTVHDVVDAALERAAREGRTTTIGRLAAGLLRSSGAWPWSVYGRNPGELQSRLEAAQRTVAEDPAAAVRVLAARAVGACYDPDPGVPRDLARRALELAERTGQDEVLADALIGQVLVFVGCAATSVERIGLLDRLVALRHPQSPLDAALRHDALTMDLLILGDLDGAVAHLREGRTLSDRLRLPTTRVQLRWMEAALAQWRGDLDQAQALGRRAAELHSAVELYDAGTTVFLEAVLRRDLGSLSSAGDLLARVPDRGVWQVVTAAEAGDLESVRVGLDELVPMEVPFHWPTLAHQVLLAHAAVQAGALAHAPVLLGRLKPYRGMVAVLGQVGVIGPVDLALGELHLLLGEAAQGEALVRDALTLCERHVARVSVLRCRLVLAQLAPPGERAALLQRVANEAGSLGARAVAEQAREHMAQPGRTGA